MAKVHDRAGRDYWDGLWSDAQIPTPIDLRSQDRRRYPQRRVAAYLTDTLATLPPDAEVLEIGCAGSPWLALVAREFGVRVAGLDYSPHGCELEREILRRVGVEGEIVCGDLFDPPPHMLDRFAMVMSFGVVEHFDDTPATVAALARFLAPGGALVTEIPNLTGVTGAIVRVANPPLYDIHVPMTARALAVTHESAGLQVVDARYLVAVGLGLWHLRGLPDTRRNRALEAVRRNLSRFSYLDWAFESRVHPLPATRALSPYIVCRAHRQP